MTISIFRVQIKAALGQHNSLKQTKEIEEFPDLKDRSVFISSVDVELVSTASFFECGCGWDFMVKDS